MGEMTWSVRILAESYKRAIIAIQSLKGKELEKYGETGETTPDQWSYRYAATADRSGNRSD
ncbi:MAG: hypothetical protein NVS2B12_19870 [Ktedonobacteraceae bacterium]